MDINKKIASELGVRDSQVIAAVSLLDEGCTIPFIARYRKEKTGSLNDEQLRRLFERLTYLRNLEEKKISVLETIESQGKLTKELSLAIASCETMVALEDIYRPYRPKRRTRAIIAKEAGLEPLSNIIFLQKPDSSMEETASPFIDEKKGICSVFDAINGASDIIAENISDSSDFRAWIRERTYRFGNIKVVAKDKEATSVYENYYDYTKPVKNVTGYVILAINRGEKEHFLNVSIDAPRDEIISYLNKSLIKNESYWTCEVLKAAIEDSYDRLISPSIERELRAKLTEMAEDGAIEVFGKNLTQLLMQPPITGRTVLGWDPAFRTGCKLAVVDPTGKVLDTAVVFPTAPTNEKKIKEAKEKVHSFIEKYDVSLISCGNGTASRESEKIITEIIHETPKKVSYLITNEAGASVYSASELATEEFPQFDVGQRSAISIARRVQDPLAELVKIDPKSIGVGQYQHDMNQKKLGEALGGVVEAAVNSVGVDLNTASFALLGYVSGISKTLAKNIVAYREKNGKFTERKQLLKVPKLGPKAYEQCAGFLRITDGTNPLDATAVHPESYEAAKQLLALVDNEVSKLKNLKKEQLLLISKATNVGEITISDIINELLRPGRDPRSEMPAPILRSDVLDIADLREGMILKGTVRNVIDFGAFVDIGVHQDGLVHISKLTNQRFVKHPLEVVSVGDIVDVKIIGIDEKKGRISLSMILDE